MLDFTAELLTRPIGADQPATRSGLVERARTERRNAAAIAATAPSSPRRRRNDAMNVARPRPAAMAN